MGRKDTFEQKPEEQLSMFQQKPSAKGQRESKIQRPRETAARRSGSLEIPTWRNGVRMGSQLRGVPIKIESVTNQMEKHSAIL